MTTTAKSFFGEVLDIFMGFLILGICYTVIALAYLACGLVFGLVFAAIAYFWPFGNAAPADVSIAIGAIVALFGAFLCRMEHFPV
ncbi:MAG: hypothetical protein M1324_02225 [Patescibacteria group bacterium]|nr:hypothetical protein [Patescibacteria group bacterium]